MADAIDIVRKSIDAWNAHDANGVAELVPVARNRRPWRGFDGHPGDAQTRGDERMQHLGGTEWQSSSGVVLLGYR
jgi:hypothetical protein